MNRVGHIIREAAMTDTFLIEFKNEPGGESLNNRVFHSSEFNYQMQFEGSGSGHGDPSRKREASNKETRLGRVSAASPIAKKGQQKRIAASEEVKEKKTASRSMPVSHAAGSSKNKTKAPTPGKAESIHGRRPCLGRGVGGSSLASSKPLAVTHRIVKKKNK